MSVPSGTTRQLVASAYSGAMFFLAVGPMIGIVLLSIASFAAWDGLQGLFAFVVFGYLFGAVPAVVAGVVFGLTYEISVQRFNKLSRYIVVFITSVAGVGSAMLFFLALGILSGLVPLVAVTASVICSFLRIREIENAGNE